MYDSVAVSNCQATNKPKKSIINRHFFKTVGLLIGLLLTTISSANEPFSLTIYTEEFPPYNYLKNGEIRGINAKLTRLICENMGIECKFELYPWNRSFAMTLNNPQGGLISTSRHPEREEQFKWVGPLESGTDRACFYKLRRRIDIPMLLDRESIKKYSFPVIRNDIYHEIFTNWGLNAKEHFVLYSNKHDGIKEFANGKLDLTIASPFTLLALLPKVGLTIDNVYPVMNLNDENFRGNYLALNPAISDDIVNKLQNSLDSISSKTKDDLTRTYQYP